MDLAESSCIYFSSLKNSTKQCRKDNIRVKISTGERGGNGFANIFISYELTPIAKFKATVT